MIKCEMFWSIYFLFSRNQQHEIDTLNNPAFKTNANWMQMLTQLIEDYQDNDTDNAKAALRKWNAERDQLR